MNLTKEENKLVQEAVRNSLDLRQRYVKLFTEDKTMKRRQKLFSEKEIPTLKNALRILKSIRYHSDMIKKGGKNNG